MLRKFIVVDMKRNGFQIASHPAVQNQQLSGAFSSRSKNLPTGTLSHCFAGTEISHADLFGELSRALPNPAEQLGGSAGRLQNFRQFLDGSER